MAQARRRAKAQWREQRRVRDQGQLQRRASEPESHRRGRSRLLACSLARLLACSLAAAAGAQPKEEAEHSQYEPKGNGRGARVSR